MVKYLAEYFQIEKATEYLVNSNQSITFAHAKTLVP